ncbi:hypothetical protein BGZ80_009413 [Entomortierella chlamydospora]|uniref:Uncharacterized protein n=1 Tax=Entomortierella chlamydospora TaxID=101097 RepID=A0A9P6T0R8_9FUNG|nr:hypothetical protein BGZ80_009413 [Entomortierella chlamydospora]
MHSLSDFGSQTPDNSPLEIEQSSPSPSSTQQTVTDQSSATEQESTKNAALCDTEEDVLQFAYRATATPAMLSRPLRFDTSNSGCGRRKRSGEEELEVEDGDKQTEFTDEIRGRNKSNDLDHRDCLAPRMGIAAVAVNEEDVYTIYY